MDTMTTDELLKRADCDDSCCFDDAPCYDCLYADRKRLAAALRAAQIEASALVTAMAAKSNAPQEWKPLPDVAGMITQVSNMAAGLRERAEHAESYIDAAEELQRKADRERDEALALLREVRTRADQDHGPTIDSEWFLLLDRIDAALKETT